MQKFSLVAYLRNDLLPLLTQTLFNTLHFYQEPPQHITKFPKFYSNVPFFILYKIVLFFTLTRKALIIVQFTFLMLNTTELLKVFKYLEKLTTSVTYLQLVAFSVSISGFTETLPCICVFSKKRTCTFHSERIPKHLPILHNQDTGKIIHLEHRVQLEQKHEQRKV